MIPEIKAPKSSRRSPHGLRFHLATKRNPNGSVTMTARGTVEAATAREIEEVLLRESSRAAARAGGRDVAESGGPPRPGETCPDCGGTGIVVVFEDGAAVPRGEWIVNRDLLYGSCPHCRPSSVADPA